MQTRLCCHPETPCDAISTIEVALTLDDARCLTLAFKAVGNVLDLKLPKHTLSARKDELWKQTCFEVFVGRGDGETYTEFNFSPSTEWAAYSFSSYREGMQPLEVAHVPHVSGCSDDDAFTLDVLGIELPFQTADQQIGVSAVIEETNGRLSYWALVHPGQKPDFHHSDGFTIPLGDLEAS